MALQCLSLTELPSLTSQPRTSVNSLFHTSGHTGIEFHRNLTSPLAKISDTNNLCVTHLVCSLLHAAEPKATKIFPESAIIGCLRPVGRYLRYTHDKIYTGSTPRISCIDRVGRSRGFPSVLHLDRLLVYSRHTSSTHLIRLKGTTYSSNPVISSGYLRSVKKQKREFKEKKIFSPEREFALRDPLNPSPLPCQNSPSRIS